MRNVSKLLTLTIVFASVVISCKKDDPAPAPTASFTYELTAGGVVKFNNTSVNTTTYTWTFGDGGSSTEMSPSYTFTANGSFAVVLNATGPGGSAATSQSVIVDNILLGAWNMINYLVKNCTNTSSNRPLTVCPGCTTLTITSTTITYTIPQSGAPPTVYVYGYTVSGKTITLTESGGSFTWTYSITGTVLSITEMYSGNCVGVETYGR